MRSKWKSIIYVPAGVLIVLLLILLYISLVGRRGKGVVGVIRQDGAQIGTVTARHGDAIHGSNLRYAPILYLGRVSKGAKIELLDPHVITNQFGIPIIKVKVLSESPTVPASSIGWIKLASTSFGDNFDPGGRALGEEQKMKRTLSEPGR